MMMDDPKELYDNSSSPLVARSRPRPMLRHSNNLHCGSFLEQLNAADEEEEQGKENNNNNTSRSSSRRKLRRGNNFHEEEEKELRHRFSTLHGSNNNNGNVGGPSRGNNKVDSDILVVRRIVSEKEEWGKFHELLKRKRQRCSTHASIQQFINGLIQEQGRQMMLLEQKQKQKQQQSEAPTKEEQKEQEEEDCKDAQEEEIRKQRLYGFYRNALKTQARPVNDDDYSIEGQFVV